MSAQSAQQPTHSNSAKNDLSTSPTPVSAAQRHTPATPVNHERLKFHLDAIGYDKVKTKYLVEGFKNGFRLDHDSPVSSAVPNNDPSIQSHHSIVQEKLDAEIAAGRLAGPFTSPPFPNCHISPLKIVPKSTPGKFRLIQNLSWPYDDSSINSNIPQESKSVDYVSIRKAIKLIMTFPKGSYTRKTDIQHAFKIIPIHPSDHHKLVFKFNGLYYYDITLPMGAGSACRIFEAFSTALQAIFDFHSVEGGLSVHYLDDFFFIDITKWASIANTTVFDNLCLDIGVPQAPDKKTPPSHVTPFLGITLDSLKWFATLPLDKLNNYLSSVHAVISRKSISQKELQSVVGKLSSAAAVVPARAFLRRLISKIPSGVSRFPIKVTSSMLQDLYAWIEFMTHYNGVTFFRAIAVLPDFHLNMGADASKQGYGATYGSYWIQERYPRSWRTIFEDKEIGITVLELFPILPLIATFGHKIKNSSILFHSDNQGVVDIINKQTSNSKKPMIMNIVRALVLLLMNHNIQLRSKHVPGNENHLCDCISRFQVTPSILKQHKMKLVPSQVPHRYSSATFKLS